MGRNLAQRRGATDAELRAADRHHDRHVRFQHGHVFHHPDDRHHSPCARYDKYRNSQTGRRSAPSAGRRRRLLLFTLGIIGTGMLGVPVLAGSCAYAVAEAAAWGASLEKTPRQAPKFYAVLGAAVAMGCAIDFAGWMP